MLVLTSIGDVLQLPHSMMNAPGVYDACRAAVGCGCDGVYDACRAAVGRASGVTVMASAASDAESHC
jgi:hypothetical protein